jgi:hypothetical protein
MNAYKVTLNGKYVDTVFFLRSTCLAEATMSLINHDGFDPMIKLEKLC